MKSGRTRAEKKGGEKERKHYLYLSVPLRSAISLVKKSNHDRSITVAARCAVAVAVRPFRAAIVMERVLQSMDARKCDTITGTPVLLA